MRTRTISQKIPSEDTGLRGSLYIHCEFSDEGRIIGVSFTERGKDGSTLDGVLEALGTALTRIIVEIS